MAFPQQQWFRKRASLLRYTYIVCLVLFVSFLSYTPASVLDEEYALMLLTFGPLIFWIFPYHSFLAPDLFYSPFF